jgi:hypothetical protein
MKIDSQEAEMSALKDLHRSYGQKVKQIETKYVIKAIDRMMTIF